MKGTLPYLNLAGVVILALFCAVQWNINRKLNLGLNAAEKVRLEQGKKLAEQEKAAQGASADLDAFRAQVQKLSIALKEAEQKAAVSERQLSQLQSSQEQTKANLAKWTEAVAARDEQLKNARAQVAELANARNESVAKFNELAAKYNAVTEELNTRTKDYNALVTRYNALAEKQQAANSK